jgi:hypothetical protein
MMFNRVDLPLPDGPSKTNDFTAPDFHVNALQRVHLHLA